MVSKGTPKINQKSLKIHPGTFQGPSQCICDPLGGKMVPKWCPRTSKWIQNAHLETLKGVKNPSTLVACLDLLSGGGFTLRCDTTFGNKLFQYYWIYWNIEPGAKILKYWFNILEKCSKMNVLWKIVKNDGPLTPPTAGGFQMGALKWV